MWNLWNFKYNVTWNLGPAVRAPTQCSTKYKTIQLGCIQGNVYPDLCKQAITGVAVRLVCIVDEKYCLKG